MFKIVIKTLIEKYITIGAPMKAELKKRLFYKVKAKDNLEDIASLFNITTEIIKTYNKIDSIEEGDVLFFPEQNIYVVKPGDTTETIAEKLNLTQDELKRKTNCNKFFIGQKIFY